MLNLNRHIRYTRHLFVVSNTKVHRSRFKVYNVGVLKWPLCLAAMAIKSILFDAVLHLMIYGISL